MSAMIGATPLLRRGMQKWVSWYSGESRHSVKRMFTLLFDSNHRVLLAQFAGILSTEDIEGFDKALAAFVSRHGFARGIFDFSSVQANAVPQSFLVWRARLPQILLGQERIFVAPQQEIYELACAYAAQQRDFGNIPGQIVRALSEAYLAFDLKQTDFRPVEEPSAARPAGHE